MSCIATITRQSATSALIVITPPTGYTVSTVNAPNTVNCIATVNGDNSIGLTIQRDRAYVSFAENAIQISGLATFQVGVVNATAASPLQVPLACNFCGTQTPMTGETYMRLIRGRATAAGPGPDVRIVARRKWGDDFAGCNVCNN
jgi:hypothetical protein